MDVNSQNYSAIKTPVPPGAKLPQIIVQMPVYKESLEEVGRQGRGRLGAGPVLSLPAPMQPGES